MIFCYFLFFYSLCFVLLLNSHFIQLLLFLEMMLLSLFLFLSLYFFNSCGLIGLFCYLLLMVCMGGFSISLLVSLARFLGRDFWYFRFII